MNIVMYVNGKRIRFFINFGWYSGEPFRLFDLNLFSKYEMIDSLYIFELTITKLMVTFGFDWNIQEER